MASSQSKPNHTTRHDTTRHDTTRHDTARHHTTPTTLQIRPAPNPSQHSTYPEPAAPMPPATAALAPPSPPVPFPAPAPAALTAPASTAFAAPAPTTLAAPAPAPGGSIATTLLAGEPAVGSDKKRGTECKREGALARKTQRSQQLHRNGGGLHRCGGRSAPRGALCARRPLDRAKGLEEGV